jgi:hypothetical protein
MTRCGLVLSAAMLTLLAPFAAPADSRSDFSGKWDMDAARSESPQYTESRPSLTLVHPTDGYRTNCRNAQRWSNGNHRIQDGRVGNREAGARQRAV